jgi:hypothetical protein
MRKLNTPWGTYKWCYTTGGAIIISPDNEKIFYDAQYERKPVTPRDIRAIINNQKGLVMKPDDVYILHFKHEDQWLPFAYLSGRYDKSLSYLESFKIIREDTMRLFEDMVERKRVAGHIPDYEYKFIKFKAVEE